MSLKDKIKTANDRPLITVDVPEWECDLRIRGMSGADRDEFESRALARKTRGGDVDPRGLRVSILIRCICDVDGNPLFTDDDAEWLAGKSGAVIDRLSQIAQCASGMTDDEVKEIEKN